MLLFLLACAPTAPADDTDDTGADVCHGDLAAGESEVVASGFEEGTEGLAFVDGRLFVSHPGGVDEIVDGERVGLVPLDSALGLAPGAGGVYVAAPGEFTLDGSGDDGALLFVGLDGAVSTLGAGMPNPNFVARLGDAMLVSDDTAAIYEVRSGQVELWTDAVPSPNGMVVAGDEVFVLSTFVQEPPLWRVPVVDGVAGAAEEVLRFETGVAPDGLAIDGEGQLWAALNLEGALARVDPATGVETTRVDGLDSPASLAFGQGSWDPCSLYVTSLFGPEVRRVVVGVAGGR